MKPSPSTREGELGLALRRARTPGGGDAASGINPRRRAACDRVFMVTDNAHADRRLQSHNTGQLLWDVRDGRFSHRTNGATQRAIGRATMTAIHNPAVGRQVADEGVRGSSTRIEPQPATTFCGSGDGPARGEPGSET